MDERLATSQRRDAMMTLAAAMVVGWAVRGAYEKVRARLFLRKLRNGEL